MKKQILNGARLLGGKIRKNSPLLLTIGTVIGVGTVIFTTAKSTIKAKEDIDDLMFDAEEDGTAVSKKDIAKVIVKDCWPVALATGATVTMTISNHRINSERIRTATVAYEFYREAYDTYRSKVREKLGETADEDIDNDISYEKAKATFTPLSIKDTGEGSILFMEYHSGRLLRACPNYIRDCEKQFNQLMRGSDWLNFNNWLNILGVDMLSDEFGDLLGFREIYDKDSLNVYFDSGDFVLPNGETPTIIKYRDRLCTEDDRICLGY